MDFTALLDVIIGLSLVYLGAALFVTIVNEYIAQVFGWRAAQLREDLKKLVDAPAAVDALKASPALAPFFEGAGSSYVDPKVLAQQLVGWARKGATTAATMAEIAKSIDQLPDSKVKTQLLALSQTTSDKVETFVANVSAWADQSLTMMGEAYKKRMQWYSFAIGLGIAIIFNLDTLGMAAHLYRDKEARTAIALAASDFVQKTSKESLDRCVKLKAEERTKDPGCAAVAGLLDGVQLRNETLGKLPLGWPPQPVNKVLPLPITVPVGWFLTALAISLGASFWFDFLGKLVNVRHGMRRPQAEAGDARSS